MAGTRSGITVYCVIGLIFTGEGITEMENKSNKGRLLFLLRYLQQNTDDQHLVTTPALLSVLESAGYPVDRKTLYDDINVLKEDFDIDIITEKHRGNEYFIGGREFELPELKLLIDAVASSRFISAKESRKLIDKLSSQASIWQKGDLKPRITIGERIKAPETRIYYTIDRLNSAIKHRKQVRFQYTEYDSRRRKILRNGGEVYTNSPYDCLWNDDKYYLIGYSEKHQGLVTFRIDRIVNLEILEEKSLPKPRNYRISDFANKVFRMYDGTLQEVELFCKEPMMKQLVDHFGTDFEVLPAEEGYFTAKIKVSVSRTFFSWLFQFGSDVRIIGPEQVREQYRRMLEDALRD